MPFHCMKYGRIYLRPAFQKINEDGAVVLADSPEYQRIDVVIECTGYLYDYPFYID